MAHPPQGLLSLPNELLRDVVAPLSPADLRHLREVNHRALEFILDYSRPRFTGLAELPNALILEIMTYLTDRDRSRLARTNFRFYSLIMDAILDQEVRAHGANLLECAWRTGSKGLMKRLLLKGANVETRSCHRYFSHYRYMGGCGTLDCTYTSTLLAFATWRCDVNMVGLLLDFGASVHVVADYMFWDVSGLDLRPFTPLSLAAYFGHERIVELLIEAGASPIGEGREA